MLLFYLALKDSAETYLPCYKVDYYESIIEIYCICYRIVRSQPSSL